VITLACLAPCRSSGRCAPAQLALPACAFSPVDVFSVIHALARKRLWLREDLICPNGTGAKIDFADIALADPSSGPSRQTKGTLSTNKISGGRPSSSELSCLQE
jgi:hypothetical protein